MKRLAIAALAASTVLTGCAGRDPVPVSAYKPSDAGLTCGDLANEIRSNNANMLVRARESSDTSDRNVMIGAAGVLLFVPLLLAIDAKDAAATENRAFEERNRQLASQAGQGGCQVPVPLTVAMAEEQIDRSKSVDTGSDGETQTASAASPVSQVSTHAGGPANSDLKALMGRFLRGEISQEQYEQQRTQLASN